MKCHEERWMHLHNLFLGLLKIGFGFKLPREFVKFWNERTMPWPIITVKLDADVHANQQIIPFDVSQETLITTARKRHISGIYIVKWIRFKLITVKKFHPKIYLFAQIISKLLLIYLKLNLIN